jgi:hypothetical protein
MEETVSEKFIVGVTTDLIRARRYCSRKYVNTKGWRVVASWDTLEEARQHVENIIGRHGWSKLYELCEVGSDGPWHVFKFPRAKRRFMWWRAVW